jgi:hypothetical protein
MSLREWLESSESMGEFLAHLADTMNEIAPVGTPCTYWTGERLGKGQRGRIRAPYSVVCNQLVGWVDGHPACILSSHIEPDRAREP